MTTFAQLVAATRSYRSFDRSVPLTREELAAFVECARLAPSSRNLQMLKFRLVTNPAECAALLPHTRWAALLRELRLPPAGHEPPAYIVICADTRLAPDPAPFQRDVGICAQCILLAATEAGFGGCMIGSFNPDGVRLALELPGWLPPQLVLALGKPDEAVRLTSPGPDGSIAYFRRDGVHMVPKRPLEELIF